MTGAVAGSRSDVGWVASTTVQQAAAIAVATISTAAAIDIAKDQHDIAERQVEIAEQIQDHLFDNYYPCELKALEEACNEEVEEPQYERHADRFTNSASLQFARVRMDLERAYNRFCCGNHVRALKDLAIAEAKTLTDSRNMAYRYAEARADALNDVRWSRRISILQMGRGLASTALAYSQAAGGTFSSLGTGLSQTASAALGRLAFVSNRNEPLSTSPQLPAYQPLNNSVQGRLSNPNTLQFDVGASYVGQNTGLGYVNQSPIINPGVNSPGDQLLSSSNNTAALFDNNLGAGVSGD